MTDNSMLGKWDSWYKNVNTMGSFAYGNTVTYQLAAEFLADVTEVEDWGCGTGGFKRLYQGKYTGLDGSVNPFVDKIVDLRTYRSNVDGIMMRHVLEHNYDWPEVLAGAVSSFRKKYCLVLFTPFMATTHEIAHNEAPAGLRPGYLLPVASSGAKSLRSETSSLSSTSSRWRFFAKGDKKHGVDVPDIAFNKKDIERFFAGFKWRGDFDHPVTHVPQSVPYDYHLFTDENLPLRSKAMTPRLQAKIPKCFGWQMAPSYDYYLWIDAGFTLIHRDSLKYFLDNCQDYDVVALRHPRRPNIWQEFRYVRRGMHQSSFLQSRYENELLSEQMQAIRADKDYVDDTLLSGGAFMYRNTSQVQSALKEWWYHISRYEIMDQLAFPYVLKKARLRINIRPDSYGDCWFMQGQGHVYRRK